mgnify:CR=1 FL=1
MTASLNDLNRIDTALDAAGAVLAYLACEAIIGNAQWMEGED